MSGTTAVATDPGETLAATYAEVRRGTEKLGEAPVTEDCLVRSMPDVSPTKRHRAHSGRNFVPPETSWQFSGLRLAADA